MALVLRLMVPTASAPPKILLASAILRRASTATAIELGFLRKAGERPFSDWQFNGRLRSRAAMSASDKPVGWPVSSIALGLTWPGWAGCGGLERRPVSARPRRGRSWRPPAG